MPDVPSKFHVSGRRLWSRLSIRQGLGTIAGWLWTWDSFSIANRFYLLEFSGIVHMVHSILQLVQLWSELLYSSVTFSQFLPGEFVTSHFLSSFQFFHLVNAFNVSFSKCSFSLSQFFVKSGLLSSRCFTPSVGMVSVHTTGMNLSLKFTNETVEKICSARREQQRLRMRHGVLDVKMTILWDTNVTLSHREKNSRVLESDMCVGLLWCLHLPSLTKESPLPVSETPCNWVLKIYKKLFIPTPCLPFVWWLPPRWRWACWWIRCVPLPASLWVNTFRSFGKQENGWSVRCRIYWNGFSASVLELFLVVAHWYLMASA